MEIVGIGSLRNATLDYERAETRLGNLFATVSSLLPFQSNDFTFSGNDAEVNSYYYRLYFDPSEQGVWVQLNLKIFNKPEVKAVGSIEYNLQDGRKKKIETPTYEEIVAMIERDITLITEQRVKKANELNKFSDAILHISR